MDTRILLPSRMKKPHSKKLWVPKKTEDVSTFSSKSCSLIILCRRAMHKRHAMPAKVLRPSLDVIKHHSPEGCGMGVEKGSQGPSLDGLGDAVGDSRGADDHLTAGRSGQACSSQLCGHAPCAPL